MRTGNNPGVSDRYFVLGGNSTDHHAHGGRDLDAPQVMNKRVQVRATNYPRTDRWVSLTTVRTSTGLVYVVGVVDGFNQPADQPHDYPTLRRARNAANRLLTELENDE